MVWICVKSCPGHQVVVIGGGMIGLLMLQLSRLAGAAKVALLEPVESKREVGKEARC